MKWLQWKAKEAELICNKMVMSTLVRLNAVHVLRYCCFVLWTSYLPSSAVYGQFHFLQGNIASLEFKVQSEMLKSYLFCSNFFPKKVIFHLKETFFSLFVSLSVHAEYFLGLVFHILWWWCLIMILCWTVLPPFRYQMFSHVCHQIE